MNSSFLFPLGTALQILGLALMIGGMLALGAFVAPVLFRELARAEAGQVMTVMFRRYDIVLQVGLGLILLGEAFRYVSSMPMVFSLIPVVRYGLIAVLALMLLYSTFSVNPKIEAMQKNPELHQSGELMKEFRQVHTLSEKVYKGQLLVAVLLLLLTPFAPGKPV